MNIPDYTVGTSPGSFGQSPLPPSLCVQDQFTMSPSAISLSAVLPGHATAYLYHPAQMKSNRRRQNNNAVSRPMCKGLEASGPALWPHCIRRSNCRNTSRTITHKTSARMICHSKVFQVDGRGRQTNRGLDWSWPDKELQGHIHLIRLFQSGCLYRQHSTFLPYQLHDERDVRHSVIGSACQLCIWSRYCSDIFLMYMTTNPHIGQSTIRQHNMKVASCKIFRKILCSVLL